MPRGGVRTGKPGEQYSNRGDLQAQPRTAGREPQYGDVAQQNAVRATPDGPPTSQGPIPPPPGSLPSLVGPSNRPDEPVTAGLTQGAGAGPDAMSPVPVINEDLFELRALYQQFPHEDLRRLIERAEREPV